MRVTVPVEIDRQQENDDRGESQPGRERDIEISEVGLAGSQHVGTPSDQCRRMTATPSPSREPGETKETVPSFNIASSIISSTRSSVAEGGAARRQCDNASVNRLSRR